MFVVYPLSLQLLFSFYLRWWFLLLHNNISLHIHISLLYLLWCYMKRNIILMKYDRYACFKSMRRKRSVFSLICWYMCVLLSDQTKNCTDLKFGTHTPLGHIPKPFLFFLFFRKSDPEGRYLSKNCRVTWISAYLHDCIILVCF